AELMGAYADTVGNLYYSGSGAGGVVEPRARLLTDMYTRTTADALNVTDAAHVNWRPLGWLTTTADLGINAISRRDEMTQPRRSAGDAIYSGDIQDVEGTGFFNSGTGSSLVTTGNLGAIAVAPLMRGLRLRTAFGGNFTRTRTHDVLATGSDLSPGASDLTGARTIIATEQRSEITTFGWYIEPMIEHRRFYLSTGLRLDGADTYGSKQSLAGFPKVSLSYLLSDEPFFPFKGLFSTLRLRAAYGQAGVQPGPADRLRLYTTTPRQLGGQTVEAHQLSSVGNDQLKPERSDEFEGGLDADLFGQAVTLELTAYRKTRTDALIPFTLPMSVNGGGTVLVNIGKVRNTGFEIGVGTQPLRSDLITIGTQMHLSRNENLVLSTGDAGSINNLDGTRVVAGYPLFGRWARPILHYADADHDGIISPDEVQVGDSLVFLGPIEPNYEAALHTNVSLYRGTITLSASFSYTRGQLQINGAARNNQFILRGANDPTAPLGEQAAVAAMNLTDYGLAQELSTFRFNSFAMALNASTALAGRLFRARTASLTLQGTNLGLWSNYRGKDPSVNAYATGNDVADTGQLPLPRTWAVGIRLGY
ncbi:MAG: TonB-dependent receptor domain-containing protein, partial [Gemmatimonadales bacterium]